MIPADDSATLSTEINFVVKLYCVVAVFQSCLNALRRVLITLCCLFVFVCVVVVV